ncbi:MAG: transporter substrate-binding domain-containing protein [Candidatus Wallbacteria bacterium]
MSIKNCLLAFCIAGLFLAPSAPNVNAQTKEVSTSSNIIHIEKDNPEDYAFLNDKIGTVISDRWSEETLTATTNAACGCKVKNFINSNSMMDCLALLKSGRADFMLTTDITSIYAAQRNPELKAVITPGPLGIVMTLRNSDTALRDSINAAIKQLKDNGTLAELEKKWINELPIGQEPSMTKIEKVSDTAETIFAGISGDMPPLDYVAADGKPAGYNIALLSEISKKIGKNIEVVSLDSQARFAALESKKIDVFFWMVMVSDKSTQEKMKENIDEQAFIKKFIVTDPHCSVKTGFLLKK